MTDWRLLPLLLVLTVLGTVAAGEGKWREPEFVGNGTLPCAYLSRDGAQLHVVFVAHGADGTATLVHRARPALGGAWSAATAIAAFAEAESAAIVGFDTFALLFHNSGGGGGKTPQVAASFALGVFVRGTGAWAWR